MSEKNESRLDVLLGKAPLHVQGAYKLAEDGEWLFLSPTKGLMHTGVYLPEDEPDVEA